MLQLIILLHDVRSLLFVLNSMGFRRGGELLSLQRKRKPVEKADNEQPISTVIDPPNRDDFATTTGVFNSHPKKNRKATNIGLNSKRKGEYVGIVRQLVDLAYTRVRMWANTLTLSKL